MSNQSCCPTQPCRQEPPPTLGSPNPRCGRFVSASAGIDPRARKRVAVGAKRAPVVGRRALLTTPNRQRVTVDLVHVVERHAIQEAVVARFDIWARRLARGVEIPDELDALDLLAILRQVDVLDQKEAAFSPFIR